MTATTQSTSLARCAVLASLAALASACGGGGGDSAPPAGPPVTVSTSSATTARYSEQMRITLVGTNLDQTLTLTSAGCKTFVRSTTAPYVSTATTAYYTCTVSGATGAQTVTVAANGGTVATVPFTTVVPQVTMVISNGAGGVAGSIVMTLHPDQAPITVDNFLAYVNAGFYSDTVFHRHARTGSAGAGYSSWVLQGGGYAAPVSAGAAFPALKPTNAPIALEVGRGLSNLRYTVAMARTSVLNSATSQFFINTVDNTFLDTSGGGYAVYATITGGRDVVDAMVTATCTLSPINLSSPDCVPEPNLVVASAAQTR